MDIEIKMPDEVEKALNILSSCGFEAYIVGGCVRDAILGSVPSDWDITTSAAPEEIKNCFRDYRTINTGLKHGTVTVIINKMHLEITTYRIDGKYSDNRRPDTVLFTDKVAMDLKRRDFTINALVYNNNGIVDLFGGIKDIENKRVKCVGVPDERFQEDGLRILRAMRFASILGFSIEKETAASIHKNKNLLNNISFERINSEFCKLLSGVSFYEIMQKYKEVVEVFIPEVSTVSLELWTNKLNSMHFVDNLILKLTLLLNDINPEIILKRLKSDNETINIVKLLSENFKEEIIPEPVAVRRWLNKIGYDNLKNLIEVKKAFFKSLGDENDDIIKLSRAEDLMNEAVVENQCYSLKTLEIKGIDIIEAGFPRGEIVGKILNEVLDKVIEGTLENNREVLKNFIKIKNTVDKKLKS